MLKRTRLGLVIRAIGENHDAAHAIGYPVVACRYLATMFGGAMAGLGGAYLSLVVTPLWVERMTAGRGWIALAIVVFAAWRPWRVVLGGYLFGGITVLQLHSQAVGVKIDAQLLAMLPLPRHHRRAGRHLARRHAPAAQRAGMSRQAVPCHNVIAQPEGGDRTMLSRPGAGVRPEGLTPPHRGANSQPQRCSPSLPCSPPAGLRSHRPRPKPR